MPSELLVSIAPGESGLRTREKPPAPSVVTRSVFHFVNAAMASADRIATGKAQDAERCSSGKGNRAPSCLVSEGSVGEGVDEQPFTRTHASATPALARCLVLELVFDPMDTEMAVASAGKQGAHQARSRRTKPTVP